MRHATLTGRDDSHSAHPDHTKYQQHKKAVHRCNPVTITHATLSPANGTRRQSSIDTLQKKGRDRRWDRSSGKTYPLLTHSASQEKSHKSAYIPEVSLLANPQQEKRRSSPADGVAGVGVALFPPRAQTQVRECIARQSTGNPGTRTHATLTHARAHDTQSCV